MDNRSNRLTALLFVMLVAAFAFPIVRFHIRVERHSTAYYEERTLLYKIIKHRPNDVSRAEWDHMVGWTITAQANLIAGGWDTVEYPAYRAYVDESRSRVSAGKIDVQLIDWIWDNYVQLKSSGKRYAAEYRPTTPESRKDITEETFGLGVAP
ncbi:MAG: hypothetical protein ACRC7O_05580 [Fimbriiglobus sp.]